MALLLTVVFGAGLFVGAGFAMLDMIAKAGAGEGFVFPIFCH